MKKFSFFLSLLLVFTLVLAACTPADEGEPGDVVEPGVGETTIPGVDVTEEPGIDVTEAPGVDVTEEPGDVTFEGPNLMRVSQLLGYEIEEDVTEPVTGTEEIAGLGHINSLVVNRQDGTIVYALVDPDDALEIDEDLVAVPWSAFRIDGMGGDVDVAEVDTDDDGPDLVYTLDRQLVVDAPAFMDDDDLNVAFPTWDDELATYWSGQVTGLPTTGAEEEGDLVRLADVTDTQLLDAEGEDIGDVEDMILDPAMQRISYVIWAAGGFLDFGEDLIPIPFEKLIWRFEADEEDATPDAFVLNVVDEEALRDAPMINLDEIDTTVADWDAEFRTFWEGIEIDTTDNQ